MCMIEDAEGWTVYRDGEQTARKEWRCCECGRSIHPGERYHYTTGLLWGESRWKQFRQCRHCRAAAEWLRMVCGGWLFEGVYEDLREHWDEYPSRELARLTSGIKVKWHGGTDPVPDWAADAGLRVLEAERQRVHAGLRTVGDA